MPERSLVEACVALDFLYILVFAMEKTADAEI